MYVRRRHNVGAEINQQIAVDQSSRPFPQTRPAEQSGLRAVPAIGLLWTLIHQRGLRTSLSMKGTFQAGCAPTGLPIGASSSAVRGGSHRDADTSCMSALCGRKLIRAIFWHSRAANFLTSGNDVRDLSVYCVKLYTETYPLKGAGEDAG